MGEWHLYIFYFLYQIRCHLKIYYVILITNYAMASHLLKLLNWQTSQNELMDEYKSANFTEEECSFRQRMLPQPLPACYLILRNGESRGRTFRRHRSTAQSWP